MILGQHGVCRIGTAVIAEHNVLLLLAGLDDFGRTSTQLVLDLLEDGNDHGRNDREDPHGHLFLELLDDLRKDRDLIKGLTDVHEKLVVKLNRRHDRAEDVLDIAGELLRLPGRDARLLHLGVGCVVLDFVHLVLLVAGTTTAEEAVGDLIEKAFNHAGVVAGVLLESAFEVLNLALGHLVGHFWGVSSQ